MVFCFYSVLTSAIYASMFLPYMYVCTIKVVAFGPRNAHFLGARLQ